MGQSAVLPPAAVLGDLDELAGLRIDQTRTQADGKNRTAIVEEYHGELELRGFFGHVWGALGFALLVIALLQLPAARRAWPRLVPGARPGRRPADRDDRMAPP